jgi:hypothetical protein
MVTLERYANGEGACLVPVCGARTISGSPAWSACRTCGLGLRGHGNQPSTPQSGPGTLDASRTPVAPAYEFYRWLLRNGRRRDRTGGQEFVGTIASDWLGAEPGGALSATWEAGQWIPQEALGYKGLTALYEPVVTLGAEAFRPIR